MMGNVRRKLLFFALWLTSAASVFATDSPGLRSATIFIIRHAEKSEVGRELSPEGQERAKAHVGYFRNFKLDYIFAAADSKESHRPRLTVEPLGKATGLTIDTQFKNKQFKELADALCLTPHGQRVLICWHQGKIPELIHALQGDPEKLMPGGKWPDYVFGWMIQLRYDANGQLLEAKRIEENLKPDDFSSEK